MDDCDVTSKDSRRAKLIHGKDAVKLRGKLTRSSQTAAATPVATKVPSTLISTCRNVRLFIDVMHVNEVAFLHATSEWIDFRVSTCLKVETKASSLSAIENVINACKPGGFKVKCIDADLQFEFVEDDVNGALIEIVDADDHANPVERSTRTVKEVIRFIVEDVPFKRLPKIMTRGLVALSTRNLNQFPSKNGMSSSVSPLTIVTGKPKPGAMKFNLDYVSYVEVFEDDGFMQNSNMMRGALAACIGTTPCRKASY